MCNVSKNTMLYCAPISIVEKYCPPLGALLIYLSINPCNCKLNALPIYVAINHFNCELSALLMFLSIDLFNCKLSALLFFLFISSFNSKISALLIYNLSVYKSSALKASLSSTIPMYPILFCLLWKQVGTGFLLRYSLKHASDCRSVQYFKE